MAKLYLVTPASLLLLMMLIILPTLGSSTTDELTTSNAGTSSSSSSLERILQQDDDNKNVAMIGVRAHHNLESVMTRERAAKAKRELGWVQIGNNIDGEESSSNCGHSVAMSSDGNRIAVSTPGYYWGNYAGGYAIGTVKIYHYVNDQWIQIGNDIDGEREYAKFGYSVAMSSNGNRVAVGTPYNGNNGLSSGHVRIYELSGNTWIQMGTDVDGEMEDDYSDYSVAMSSDGGRVAIGARNNDGGNISGHVRVYEYNGNNWNQLGGDIHGEEEHDAFGKSVAMSSTGERIIIGAPNNGNRRGHVRIYEFDGSSSWNQIGGDVDGKKEWEHFGDLVTMSSDGNRVAVAAPSKYTMSHDVGQVRVYDYDGNNWNQIGQDIDGTKVDTSNTASSRGLSISMSSDGNRIVVGSTFTMSWNFDEGHVSVYDYNADIWVKVGDDIDGEKDGDEFGRSVAMSSDGSKVIIGAPYNDGKIPYTYDVGRTQIFEIMEIPTQPPSLSPQPSPSLGTPPSCTNIESSVLYLELKTDNFPQETSWQLLDTNSNLILHEEVEAYDTQLFIYKNTMCIPRDSCYQIKIFDSFGDGIISPGYFKIIYEGIVVMDLSGENFFGTSSKSFGDECYPSLSPTPLPSASSTPTPTSNDEFPIVTVFISSIFGGFFLVLVCISYVNLLERRRERVIINSNEEQSGNSSNITVEEQRQNRRLKVLTGIIHKKVLSTRKLADDNHESSVEDFVLPHEKELSNRALMMQSAPSSSRSINSKNDDEALRRIAEAYNSYSIFPISIPNENENKNENKNNEQKEQDTVAENNNNNEHLKNDIYLASFRKSNKSLRLSRRSSLYSPKSCPICLEEYKTGDEIAWSKNHQCPHAFHLDCIIDWLMDNEDCPLCRADYLKDEES